MNDLIEQLSLPSNSQESTLYVKRLKETLAAYPNERGNKLSYTMKISRDRHGKILGAAAKHGMTVTDLITGFIDRVLPVLQQADPVEVPGYRLDHRAQADRHGHRAKKQSSI
jgi:hypothetical protein